MVGPPSLRGRKTAGGLMLPAATCGPSACSIVLPSPAESYSPHCAGVLRSRSVGQIVHILLLVGLMLLLLSFAKSHDAAARRQGPGSNL
jgi:hypothetical protein